MKVKVFFLISELPEFLRNLYMGRRLIVLIEAWRIDY